MTEEGWQVYRNQQQARKAGCFFFSCRSFSSPSYKKFCKLPRIMQPVFSLAVVFMALSVVAGSDEAPVTSTEPTLAQKFEKFQRDFQTLVERFGEKTRAAFHDLQQNELSNKTRNWFTENFQKLKEKFKATLASNKESSP